MFVERIKLLDFRNYEALEINAGRGMNIFYGNNGNGKTNILEAMFLCAAGRSHRTAKDAELIRFGASCYYAGVEFAEGACGQVQGQAQVITEGQVQAETGDAAKAGAQAQAGSGSDAQAGSRAQWEAEAGGTECPGIKCTVETAYEAGGRKKVKLNGVPVDRLGNSIGKLKAVMFSPEDVGIIKEGPAERRRLLDMAISQQKPLYFFDLQQYNRILMQKNALLKRLWVERDAGEMLDVWNGEMARTGARIMVERKNYIGAINRYFTGIYAELASGTKNGQAEEICMSYVPSLNLGADGAQSTCKISAAEAAEIFRSALEKTKEREIEAACSLTGPQRDDLKFTINGGSLKLYGSQGQQRTAMLALKLAEIEMSREITGETPILLLDDVMSELDRHRRKYLYGRTRGIQTFITCTDRGVIEKGGDKRYYYVEKGSVKDKTAEKEERVKAAGTKSGAGSGAKAWKSTGRQQGKRQEKRQEKQQGRTQGTGGGSDGRKAAEDGRT